MDKKPLSLIEFGVAASVGALALLGASTLIGYTKRAKQARIQHDTPEYSDESPGYSDEKIQALIKEGYIPIATAEELNSIRNTSPRFYGVGTKWKNTYKGGLDKKYVQVANIDLSEYGDWTPIGTLHANFSGTYDGGNYVITGLKIKGKDNDYQGLFGRTEEATISNVALEDVNVTGAKYVGGLVGYAAEKTEISNSYATGSVTGKAQVGGLVGGAENSMIINSYTEGTITGINQVGGLVGLAYDDTEISNSYSTCSATGSGVYVGGLVGYVYYSATISNSYATGSVKGNTDVGGLVGYIQSSAINSSYSTGAVTGASNVGGLVGVTLDSTINSSYTTGLVTGNKQVGGLVGYVARRTRVYNSYWDKETTERTYSSGVGMGKSTEEMKKKETYLNWNFSTVWEIDDGDYPTLRQRMVG